MVKVLLNGLLKRIFRKDYEERVLPRSGLLEQIHTTDLKAVSMMRQYRIRELRTLTTEKLFGYCMAILFEKRLQPERSPLYIIRSGMEADYSGYYARHRLDDTLRYPAPF